jgi:hypothetical protein
MMIKAIETYYNGYRFRSRLEARRAVFLDTVGIHYQYEPEGFDLDGLWYLPDLYVPALKAWIEIKPELPTGVEADKLIRFDKSLYRPNCDECLDVLVGQPWADGRKKEYAFCHGMGETLMERDDSWWAHCPLCGCISISSVFLLGSRESDGAYFDMLGCMKCDLRDRGIPANDSVLPEAYFHKGSVISPPGFVSHSPRLRAGYAAARAARFEHGETPRF